MAEQATQFGKEHRDPFPGPHSGDHEGHVGAVVQELSALSPPEVRTVDPGQDGRAGDSSPVEQLAGSLKGRHLIDAILTRAEQGESGRLTGILTKPDQVYV